MLWFERKFERVRCGYASSSSSTSPTFLSYPSSIRSSSTFVGGPCARAVQVVVLFARRLIVFLVEGSGRFGSALAAAVDLCGPLSTIRVVSFVLVRWYRKCLAFCPWDGAGVVACLPWSLFGPWACDRAPFLFMVGEVFGILTCWSDCSGSCIFWYVIPLLSRLNCSH